MSPALDKLFRGIQFLIAGFLGVMIFLTFLNVVLRYVFNTGFTWSEEVTRICFIYLVYLGTIDAFRDNRHLGVEMMIEKVGQKTARVLYLAIQVITIWMMGVLAWGSYLLAAQNINAKWVATQYPTWLISGIGVVTGISIILLALSNIVQLLRGKGPLELMTPVDSDAVEFSMD